MAYSRQDDVNPFGRHPYRTTAAPMKAAWQRPRQVALLNGDPAATASGIGKTGDRPVLGADAARREPVHVRKAKPCTFARAALKKKQLIRYKNMKNKRLRRYKIMERRAVDPLQKS